MSLQDILMQIVELPLKHSALPGCAERDVDLSGTYAGQFRLVSRIGTRGAADLYAAKRRFDDLNAVVKIVDTLWAPARIVQAFNEERRLIGHFDHPNLAKMVDRGTTDTGALYLAVEQVEGVPLLEFAKQSSLRGPACIGLMLQLCSVVEYLHSEGFAHHDLRSENIVVRQPGNPAIIDFGKTAPIPAMPRERSEARADDVRDLGLLLYEITAGTRWPELEEIIEKAIEAEQLGSASELAHELQTLL
jgi:eukaryotic-like serine/threonine-protein kinase